MTLHPYQLLRFLFIILLATAAGFLLPTMPHDVALNIFPVMLVFSFLIGFLINRAIERAHSLSHSVAKELSRLRRIAHLAEMIRDTKWHTALIEALDAYQTKISSNFREYGSARAQFRKITHLIYSFIPKNRHEELVLSDLLATTRDLAYERQHIEQAIGSELSPYSWLFMGTITGLLMVLLILDRGKGWLSQLVASAGVTAALLATDYLSQINHLQQHEVEKFQTRYQDNIAMSKG